MKSRRMVAGIVLVAASACTPTGASTTSTTTTTVASGTPTAPVIHAFSVVGNVPSAPALVALSWNVTDANGDAVTCRIDGDGDGVVDEVVSHCERPGSRNVLLSDPGTFTASIQADDGTEPAVVATKQIVVAAGSASPFSISIQAINPLTAAVQASFDKAVTRWTKVVTRATTDATLALPAGYCLAGAPPVNGTVHNVIIDVNITAIDGVGGILGQSGPCVVSSADGLTKVGDLELDSADVATMLAGGTLDDVILHEIDHILGFGTLWDEKSLLTGPAANGGTDPRFVGPHAIAEYSRLGGSAGVPVEATGGPGTQDSHWRESTFANELMTGWISAGSNPLSRVTIASLADLGYHVDLSQADAYSLPGGAAARSGTAPQRAPMLLHGPKASV